MSKSNISCPKCHWKPYAWSRWQCSRRLGGCGHVWNTFDTRGVCPQCSWHWIITACLWCKQFSPHEEWYHDPNEDSGEKTDRDLEVEKA